MKVLMYLMAAVLCSGCAVHHHYQQAAPTPQQAPQATPERRVETPRPTPQQPRQKEARVDPDIAVGLRFCLSALGYYDKKVDRNPIIDEPLALAIGYFADDRRLPVNRAEDLDPVFNRLVAECKPYLEEARRRDYR